MGQHFSKSCVTWIWVRTMSSMVVFFIGTFLFIFPEENRYMPLFCQSCRFYVLVFVIRRDDSVDGLGEAFIALDFSSFLLLPLCLTRKSLKACRWNWRFLSFVLLFYIRAALFHTSASGKCIFLKRIDWRFCFLKTTGEKFYYAGIIYGVTFLCG